VPGDGAGGSRSATTQQQQQQSKQQQGDEVLIPCCFSFTIRRDQWNIPICIVGNFLMIDPS